MNSLITSAYRKQHDTILDVSSIILDSLDPQLLKDNSHMIRRRLSKLAGLVKIHLVLEDNSLYPLLANSEHKILRETSLKFIDEMGDISKSFADYMDRWSTSSSIKNKTDQFIHETQNLMDALKGRIMRENDNFYNLIDDLLSN